MPIVTIEKVNLFGRIEGIGNDILIQELIPEIEADYLMLRNRPFPVISGNITDGSAVISLVQRYDADVVEYQNGNNFNGENYDYYDHLFDELTEGMTVSDVTGSNVFGKIISIDKLNQAITLDSNSKETVFGKKLYVYPVGCQLVASEMIKYQMSKRYVGSESFGDYSFTNEQMIGGYPKSIVGKINRFVSVV
jgi:hypothetical protein